PRQLGASRPDAAHAHLGPHRRSRDPRQDLEGRTDGTRRRGRRGGLRDPVPGVGRIVVRDRRRDRGGGRRAGCLGSGGVSKKPATAIAPWQVLDSTYPSRVRWLAVRSDTVRVPNGTVLSPYHTIEFPEWVCAIALTPEREIVLIEEYRHGIERNSFELPCGTPDHEGESVLEATKRELREETGYSAD